MPSEPRSRRQFLRVLSIGATTLVIPGARVRALDLLGSGSEHPDPRPGIDGSKVLTVDQLHSKDALPVYDMIRSIPEVADGVRCQCGCADLPEYYSLLTCYEGGGMAQHCEICLSEARLVYRFHKDGRPLNEIRAAVDAEFG